MKLHSDTLTSADVESAAAIARSEHGQDIYITEIHACGSRSRARGLTFYCGSLGGRRATNRGDGERAATWTAWGYLIAELFRRDPDAIMTYYKSAADFQDRTQARYVPRGGSNSFLEVLV